MKTKRLLRFYFSAETVDRALNNLITAAGCSSGNAPGNGLHYAEKMLQLIDAKRELGFLWNYLDGVMKSLGESDRLILKKYGLSKSGLSKSGEGERREIRRAAIKFTRHARGIARFSATVELIGEYYALMY